MKRGMLLALAPMKDISDLAFIKTLHELGSLPDYFVTEYFRTQPHHKKMTPYILRSIDENPTACPIFGQLNGSDTAALVRDAQTLMRKHPCTGVNLNMGCPAPLVCRRGAGGGLLRSLKTMDSVLGALREALPEGAFTIKCRIGFEEPDEFERILPIIARHAPDRVCIHARTVREGYRSTTHPEWVKRAREVLRCPVIANGSIVDCRTARAWIEQIRPDGLMIGRAATRNPWIFRQLRSYFEGESIFEPSYRDIARYIHCLYEHTKDMRTGYVEAYHVKHLKKYLVYIACGLPEEFGYAMKRAQTAKELMGICERFLEQDTPYPLTPPEDAHLFAGFSTLCA